MTLAGQHLPAPAPATLAALAGFTAVWLVAGVWTQLYGATHLEAGTMGVLVIFELLTAIVSAMVVGGERLDSAGWTGAALIVAAALIEARAGSRPPSPTNTHALTPESP
jgi:drug/metabolite transporter (DMT)-like permease